MGGRRLQERRTILAAASALSLIAATGAFLVIPASGQEAGTVQQPRPGAADSTESSPPPLAEGPAPDLDLVFTAQVIGWIEPCG